MASSIVDKYEQILAADPRSRIFVELAKALVDRGEHARAIEVCERGLGHHPSSILGRVVWGRALLEAGDPRGAMDQFEIAIGLDPSSPYAYNHVGEALVAKGLCREALPVLARAAELQPGDARVKARLEEAEHRARGESAAPAAPRGKLALEDEGADERTEPYRPIAGGGKRVEAGRASRAPAGERAAGGAVPGPPVLAASSPPNAAANAAAPASAGSSAAASPGATPADGAPRPPPLPPGRTTPPPRAGANGSAEATQRSVLYMIPGETREVIGPAASSRAAPAPQAHADHAEAERIAEQFERELREQLAAAPAPPPSFLDRHRRLVAAAAIATALAAAAGVYVVIDGRNAEVIAASAASRGRAGLARDTLGSLREAHRLLSEARRRTRADPEVASLAAQVAAVLASEHGDEDARAVALELARDASAGDGAAAARWLLAGSAAERKAAEADVLAARPSSAPLVQALAGRILVARGEVAGGRGRLEIAAQANPPLLRALSDLGDLALARGDAERALAVYRAALEAHPTHPRSAVGAAEARLALGDDLDLARRDLERVDADEASATPRDLRPRFEIALARVLAATGDPAAAANRLGKASASLGESAALAAALAEVELQARRWDRAEAAAARAVRLAPRDVASRVLLARARIGRGRHREALAATDGHDGRAVRIQRAIARYRLGQYREARAELERTAQGGKMAAEAAVWYALADVASGRTARALPLLERLAGAASPPPLAHVALGRAHEADGRLDAAEAAYRAGAEREASEPEGHLALGRLLLARGRAADAIAPLERAVKLDPSDLPARRALGEARLAAGHPSAARADLDFVLLATPRDPAALRLLSAAWLAEKEPAEARRAAERAVAAAPRDPAARLAAARAALAQGERAAARASAERALKLGARGDAAAEARRLVAEAGRRR